MAARTETQSIETGAEPDAAFARLADPRRVPEWAPAFADVVGGGPDEGWRVTKDGDEFALTVAVHEPARTVDYLREVAPGLLAGAYLRVVPRLGGGSAIVMTLPVPPGTDPAEVAATLGDELRALARLAEAG